MPVDLKKFLSETAPAPATQEAAPAEPAKPVDLRKFPADTAPPPESKDAYGVAADYLRAGIEGAGHVAAEVSDVIGKPIRRVVDKLTRPKPTNPREELLQAAADEDGGVSIAPPSWKELYTRAGLSDDKSKPAITLPIIQNPWGTTKADKFTAVTPAGAAAAATGFVLDPLNAAVVLKVPEAVSAGIRASTGAIDAAGKGAADFIQNRSKLIPKAGKVFAGVDEKATQRYLSAPERVNAAPTSESIKRVMDDDVAQVLADKEGTATAFEHAKEKLDSAYSEKLKEMTGRATPLSQAREIMASLDDEKKVLGTLSVQADDALERSGVTFRRDDLLRLIKKSGKALGDDIVSKGAKEAIGDLTDLHEVVSGLPKEIDAVRLRNILKQVRDDLNYAVGAGEFNSAKNKVFKEFARGVSDALKTSSPEYAAYMARMADISENLEAMASHFGNEQKALSSFEAIRKGNAVRAQVVEDAVRSYARTTGNKNLAAQIDEMARMRETASAMKNTDLRKAMFPDLAKAAAEREAEMKMAGDIYEDIKRVTPERTQAIVRNQGNSALPNIEDADSIAALRRSSGRDYQQMIQDRGALDAFSKDHTRGARNTLWGGAVGGAAGSLLGHTEIGVSLGVNAGMVADKFGSAIFKGSLDKTLATLKNAPQALGKYEPFLRRAAAAGGVTLDALHHTLMENDPEYRAMVEHLGDFQRPGKAGAIDRRINKTRP